MNDRNERLQRMEELSECMEEALELSEWDARVRELCARLPAKWDVAPWADQIVADLDDTTRKAPAE